MKKIILCITMSVLFFYNIGLAENNYKIGVLAKNGPVKALKMWKSTGEYLQLMLKGLLKSYPLILTRFFLRSKKAKSIFFWLIRLCS